MTTPSNKKVFKVGAVGVRIRTEPRRGASEVRWAKAGELLSCDLNSRTEAEGFVWWHHPEGWSAERNTAGTEFYMHEQTAAETPAAAAPVTTPGASTSTPATTATPVTTSAPVTTGAPVTIGAPATAGASTIHGYKVGSMMVRVRATPSLSGAEVRWLNPGEVVQCDENTRTTADGYVWIKHQFGWSAVRNLDESLIFLYVPPSAEPTPAAPATTVTPVATTTAPAPAVTTPTTPAAAPDATSRASAIPTSVIPAATTPAAPSKVFRVSRTQVRVRAKPSLTGEMVRWLLPGETITVDTRQEADGFIWWHHSEGWTAERSLDGTQEFLVDPETFAKREAEAAAAAATPSSVSAPDGTTLPNLNSLFTRFPMALEQTEWWQYFGNNVFAYNLWRDGKKWYSYCQALHGGLDFGNSRVSGIPIYAGVHGTYQKTITSSYAPFGIFVKSGDYTIIYGHLINPRQFAAGAIITPDTVLGECQVPGQNHLHLEVRYKEVWIVNPLLFFSEAMRAQVFNKFPPGPNHFYRDARWSRWQTPLDQPILKLGAADIIGPHAK